MAAAAKMNSQSDAEKPNPIRKILNMLEDMRSELEKEAKDEKNIFEEAMCLCKKGEKELKGVIMQSKSDIERFTTKVESDTAMKQQLTAEVAAHKQDQEDTAKALSEATVIREKEAKEFAATEADLKTNLEGLNQAIPLIEGKSEGGASFAQIKIEVPNLQKIVASSTYLSLAARSQVASFLEDKEPSAGVAEILGMLKGMKDEMAKDLKEATEEEESSVAAYLDMKKNKEEHSKLLIETIMDKEKRTGETALSLSQSKDSLEDAETELEDAEKYLTALTTACADREKNRDARAKMRTDEITAISEAINILSDDDALDAMNKAQPGAAAFLQQGTAPVIPQPFKLPSLLDHSSVYIQDLDGARTSFLQLVSKHRMKRSTDNEELDEDANGPEAGSQAVKVVGYLIDGMVKVLHDDDVDDEHKKDWCFNETQTQTQLQGDKTVFQENLAATIEKQNETLFELDADIKELEKSIYDLDQSVLKASALRKEQHEEFVGTFNAMDTAIRLIDRAELKLQEFYNPKMVAEKKKAVADAAAEAAGYGFLQAPHAVPVSTYDHHSALRYWDQVALAQTSSTHKLAQAAKATNKVDPIVIPETPTVENYEKSESGGVLGLMNKLRDEVKMDLKEAEMEEKYAAKDYTEEMKEATAARGADAKALTTKKEQQASLADKQQSDKETNDLTLEELNSIKLYLRELDIECTFILKNYEARHGARVGEETGLEGAETIVTHEEPPSYEHNEKKYEQEHSANDVDEHFPDKPMPKPQR